jgi:antitoxin component YwqK of YwqJK toxin-antitoxin module
METEFYDNGQIKYQANFKNNQPHGVTTKWYEDGEIKERVTFNNGQVIETYHMRIIEK